MLFDLDNWKEVTATLSRNKTRTFLTAFGIFWGTLMLALLWGGSQGLQNTLTSYFDGFASNTAIVIVQRTTMPYKGYQKGMEWNLDNNDINNLKNLMPELATISPMCPNGATMKYKDKSSFGMVTGYEPNFVEVLRPKITSGRFINDADMANCSKVCVLGDNVARTLFGDVDPIGKFVESNNVFFRVVGTYRQTNDISLNGRLEDGMAIPLTTMQLTSDYGDKVGYMAIVAKPQYKPSALKDKVFSILRRNHPLHPDDTNAMFYMDVSDMFDQVNGLFTGVDILILFVGLSSLIAGIIGVGNIMWIIVKERTKEFGIRRALGARPMSIMYQIMAESAVLTCIAGTAGIVAAVGILALATKIILGMNADLADKGVTYQLTFGAAIAIMVCFLVLGSLAGSIPAIKAMRIKPIEALNDK